MMSDIVCMYVKSAQIQHINCSGTWTRNLHAMLASLKCNVLLLLLCQVANFAAGNALSEPFFLVAWPVPHAVN